jgi:hypothetical protein
MRPKITPKFNDKQVFNSACSPIGYNLYLADGVFTKFFFHIRDLRQYCIKENLTPLDVKITRVLSDKKVIVECNMVLSDYAYSSTIVESVSLFNIEREAWSWEEEKVDVLIKKKIKKGKSFLFNKLICWTNAVFSIFR